MRKLLQFSVNKSVDSDNFLHSPVLHKPQIKTIMFKMSRSPVPWPMLMVLIHEYMSSLHVLDYNELVFKINA